MVKVLADYHHSDLFRSLQLLFEDRFGWEVYAPIGWDWWTSDTWCHERYLHGDQVGHQYLDPWGSDKDCGDHSEREDWQHPGVVIKYLTMDQARAVKPDIVLATLQHNEVGFHKFAKEIGAKFGLQLGNQGSTNRFDLADFAMLSTTRPETSFPCPTVTYHQEFDIKTQYTYHYPPEEKDTVCTFVQVLYASSGEQDRFDRLAKATPELRWYTHGHDTRNPYFRENIKNTPLLAKTMQACRVGAQLKTWSDGFGHVVYSLWAIGKPCIATASYYLGRTDGMPKLAGELMEDGVTCFDVQAHTDGEAVEFIRRLVNDEDYYRAFSERVYARFKSRVDFDYDAEQIKKMLEKVLT